MNIQLTVGLRIRFGLRDLPDDAQIERWVNLTDELVAEGISGDDAAEAAAQDAFHALNEVQLYSQMHTIAWLLAEARTHSLATQEARNGKHRSETANQIRINEHPNRN